MHKATVRRYYRVDRREIHFLKFILEGYDGVAVVRTVDPTAGLVALHIGVGCQSIVDMIIKDLERQIRIEPLGLMIDDWRLKERQRTSRLPRSSIC
jgi:hypothetical protein